MGRQQRSLQSAFEPSVGDCNLHGRPRASCSAPRARPRAMPAGAGLLVGTSRASHRGVSDPRVAWVLYGTLAVLYGLSVWAIRRQRRRGERAPGRGAAAEVDLRESRAALARPFLASSSPPRRWSSSFRS